MTGTLADRLTARLDEVEALAAEAPGGPWEADGPYVIETVQVLGMEGVSPPQRLRIADCNMDSDLAAFIAAMSPDRVLALVAADRRLIERHVPDAIDPPSCFFCDHGGWPCADLTDHAAAWGVA